MKAIGLFRELSRDMDRSVQSIHAAVGTLEDEAVMRVVEYLRSGIPVFDVMEATVDPLDSSVSISGGPSLISDGVWVWREDLAYYVERYKVGLPSDFVSFALRCGTVAAEASASVAARWEEALAAYDRAEKGFRAEE